MAKNPKIPVKAVAPAKQDGTKIVTCEYKPLPKQMLLHRSPANEILFGGAAGPGKSRALREEALTWCLRIPGLQVYLFRRIMPELEKNHIIPSLTEFPAGVGKYKDQKRRWEFRNKSMLHFCHAQYEMDIFSYQGAEIHWLAIDELTTFCVLGDTDVLTANGWKPIKDCKANEMVMSLSADKNKCEFKKIEDVYEFDYRGEILTSKTRKGMDFDVTPNHRMVAMQQGEYRGKRKRWEFCQAKDLPEQCFFPRTGEWKGRKKSCVNLSVPSGRGLGRNQNASFRGIPINDWCYFIGWYLSEGSAWQGKKNKNPIVDIAQYSEPEKLVALLERLPWKFKRHDRGYRIFSRQLYEAVKDIGNSHTKRVPRDLLSLPREALQYLLDGYLEGDGCKTNFNSWGVSSASEGLIDDVQELCVRLGLISTKRGPQEVHSVLPTGKPCTSKITSLFISNPKRHITQMRRNTIKKRQYEGKVCCIKVKDNTTFMARTRGKIWWSGNSELMYDYLRGRTRCTLEVPKKYKHKVPGIVCASNPGGVGHNFVKRRWVDFCQKEPGMLCRAPKGDGGMLRAYIPALLDDNPILTRLDPGYANRLDGLPEPYRTAYRDGDWEIFMGQAFNFSERDHMIDPIPVPDNAPLMMTFDWGISKPYSVGWWWIDADDRLYRFTELYGCMPGMMNTGVRHTDEEIAERIIEHEENEGITGRQISRLCDPTCFNRKPDYRGGGQGPSTAEVLARAGIVMRPGDANRKLKIRQFHQRLRIVKGEMPMMVVYRCCTDFIRTIPLLQSDPHKPEDVDTRMEDHQYDEACHACMSRPIGTHIVGQDQPVGIEQGAI